MVNENKKHVCCFKSIKKMNLVFEKKWSHGGVKEGSFSEEFCIKKVFHF